LTPSELLNIIGEWIKKDGFVLESDVQDILLEIIELVSRRNSYAGLRTIRRTLDALELYLAVTKNQNVITRECAKDYIKNYLEVDIKREMHSERKIGF